MLAALLALIGCGGGGGDGSTEGSATGGISAPTITSQPASVSVAAGSGATFTVGATGGGLAFQWFRSTTGGLAWTEIAGATTASFAITAVDAAMNGHQFRVVVQNVLGLATSSAATLTVDGAVGAGAPVITRQPANQNVTVPAAATFSVVATSASALSYQWQVSTDAGTTFAPIPGATAAIYTTPATAATDSGRRYRVVLRNATGTIASNVAILTATVAGGGGGVPGTCVPPDVLPAGLVLQAQWNETIGGGGAGSTFSATQTIVGPSSFQGRAAFEVKVESQLLLPSTTRMFSSYDTASRVLTPYGAIVRIGADSNSYTQVVSVARQPARYPIYALGVGQSETVTVTSDNTQTVVTGGVAGAAITTTETTTTTYTFDGTATITVPAGTFLTCKYTERDAGGRTKTNWLMVGYGVNVRNVIAWPGGADQTQTLTALTVNGVPLTRFP
jgi:hypothetical protein